MDKIIKPTGYIWDSDTVFDRNRGKTQSQINEDTKIVGDLGEQAGRISALPLTWIRNSINATGGNTGALSTTRFSTADISLDSQTDDTIDVVIAEGWKWNCFVYDSAYQYVFHYSSLQTAGTTLTIQRGYIYRFTIGKIDDSDVTGTDPNDVFQLMYKGGYQKSIVELNDPKSMKCKLDQIIRPTRTGSTKLARTPLVLLHFSDVHGDKDRLKNIVEFKNAYSSYIRDILNTGDSVIDSYEEGLSYWDEVEGADAILNTIGNHDTRIGDVWIGADMQQSYERYMAPYISKWGVSSVEGKTYYYKDYADSKVRLIVLDIMHQTADQLSWFVETLEGARVAGYDVLAAGHSRAHWMFSPYDTPWDDAPHAETYSGNNYQDSSSSTYPQNFSDDYTNAVDDFIDAGGNFIAWLHGHTHFKMFARVTPHQRQLDIAVGTAACPAYAWTYVESRMAGSKSADNFNIVGIDTYAKVIRIVKVGVDYDRFMRHTDTISYDYANHVILSGETRQATAFLPPETQHIGGWLQGTINAKGGWTADSDTRIRSSGYEKYDGYSKVRVTCSDGYKFTVREYTVSDTGDTDKYIGSTTGFTNEFSFAPTPGHCYRYVVGKTDDSNISPGDFDTNDLSILCFEGINLET